MKTGWGRFLESLKKLSTIPVIIAALTAIDQLRGAREAMRSIGEFLRTNLAISQEVLNFLNAFRQFFAAAADLIFFWVPSNIRSMLLVVTILFGGAALHYVALLLLQFLRRFERALAFRSLNRQVSNARWHLRRLDAIGEALEQAKPDHPNIRLNKDHLLALTGDDADYKISARILGRPEYDEVAARRVSRTREVEAVLERAEETILGAKSGGWVSGWIREMVARPPRIPVYKYAYIVGTLVLCIGVNYIIYPISGELFSTFAGDPDREVKISEFIKHKEDYIYHVTLGLIYSAPVFLYVFITIFLNVRGDFVSADMRAITIVIPIVFFSAFMGWDEYGLVSAALCVGLTLSMYVIAINTFAARRIASEESWLALDLKIGG